MAGPLGRTVVVLAFSVTLANPADAGPLVEIGLGWVAPQPDDRDDSADRTYNEVIHGGPHLSFHVGWLFPIVRHPAVRVKLGPVASAAHTWYRDFEPDDGLDGVTRWRFTGGARLAFEQRDLTFSIEGLIGVDRPAYNFDGLVEAFCGDPTTSGDAWEVTALGQLRRGPVVFGAAIGVLHGDHRDDRPACTNDIVIDVVDYTSVDITPKLTLGVTF